MNDDAHDANMNDLSDIDHGWGFDRAPRYPTMTLMRPGELWEAWPSACFITTSVDYTHTETDTVAFADPFLRAFK